MIEKLFSALSEESRLRILSVLMEQEMCVCEIEVCLKMTQSNASRHLTELKKCGILESYKEAQWAYYRISDHFKQENKNLWEYLQIQLKQLKTYQEDYIQYEKCKENDICAHIRNNQ
jgi:ArsR family transcriptional regulator